MQNEIFKPGYRLSVIVTDPAVPNAGDPVRYGFMTGVALTDEAEGDNPAGYTSVDFGPGVYTLPVTDSVGGGIALGDTLFYVDASDDVRNNPAGYFFGFALQTVGMGATTNIRVLHVPAPGSGVIGAGTIATANLAAGILSADAPGRAKMAASYFTTAQLISTIAADQFTNAFLIQAILDGAFQADAATRALFADAIWTEAKIENGAAGAGLTGLVAKFVADANVIGGIPVVHRIAVADAGANVDVVLTHKTRIFDIWVNKDATIGAAGDKIMVCKGTNATPVTEDLVVGGVSANAHIHPATLLMANCEIAAGGTLRIQATKATAVGCTVYVVGMRVA